MTKKIKPTKNRTSLMSNELFERHRYNLSINAQKVLFGLAQSIDHNLQLFEEMQIDIEAFFKFLDIKNRNDRYDLVRDAIFEITENPLQYSSVDAKKWSSIPWLSVKFDDSDSTYIKIRFTEEAKPLLMELNGYVKIQGRYITAFQSQFATWLYPRLKVTQGKYYGSEIISMEDIMHKTFTENKKKYPSYHDPKNGKNNWMTRVLGLKKKGTEYEIIPKSPLGEINECSDVTVSVKALKTGRKIDRFEFTVKSKIIKEPKQPETTKKYDTLKESFSAYAMSLADLHSLAKSFNKSPEQLCKENHYIIKGNKAYKANPKWVKNQKHNNLFNKALD